MKKIAIFLFCLVGLGTVSAQSSIVVQADSDVSAILDAFVQVNTTETKVEGWRVQILATADRRRLEAVERNFKLNYPSIPVDWVHAKPYYKLRAGAFQTKQEAERLKYTLGRQFDGVYLVKDQVSENELLRMY
ncbi:MAG: SPOR domain-containing protein [Bacteroidota bacterium]